MAANSPLNLPLSACPQLPGQLKPSDLVAVYRPGVNPTATLFWAYVSQLMPQPLTPTDRGGTITNGGTAQSCMAQNNLRKGGQIQNPPDAQEPLYVSVTGSASVNGDGNTIALAPGQVFNLATDTGIIQTAVTVNAATTGHRFIAVELQ